MGSRAKVITVLASTFMATLLGLLIGYLRIQANMPFAQRSGMSINSGDLFVSYAVAPVAGSVIGFVLAIATVTLFGSEK